MKDAKLLDFISTENFREALGAFLARQRWFSRNAQGDKTLSIEVLDVSLPCGFFWLHGSLGKDTYRIPIAWHSDSLFIDANAKIAIDPASGCAVSDAFFHTEFTTWMLGVSTQDNFLETPLVASRSVTSSTLDEALVATVNQCDQTNTCVFYKDKYFLKFYRKVELGWNHECATLKALETAQHKDSRVTPRLLAEVRYQESTLWSLQEQVAHASNLWVRCVSALEAYEHFLTTDPAASSSATEFKGALTAYAFAAGRSLALLHLQLSRIELGYPRRLELSPSRLFSDWQRLLEEWEGAKALQATTLREVASLKKLWDRYVQLPNQSMEIRVQRVHGDLHLGQMLWTQNSKVIITDFDGEPLRCTSQTNSATLNPCEEDLAAMMRSWEYLLDHRGETTYSPTQREQFKATLKHHFFEAYRESIAAHDHAIEIHSAALDYACLAKCLRECEYEWRYRPDWLMIPLKGMTSHLIKQLQA